MITLLNKTFKEFFFNYYIRVGLTPLYYNIKKKENYNCFKAILSYLLIKFVAY